MKCVKLFFLIALSGSPVLASDFSPAKVFNRKQHFNNEHHRKVNIRLWPLLHMQQQPSYTYNSVLWPLFHYQQNKALAQQGYHNRYYHLFVIGRMYTPTYERSYVIPLFFRRHNKANGSKVVLALPTYFSIKRYDKSHQFLLPIFYRTKSKFKSISMVLPLFYQKQSKNAILEKRELILPLLLAGHTKHKHKNYQSSNTTWLLGFGGKKTVHSIHKKSNEVDLLFPLIAFKTYCYKNRQGSRFQLLPIFWRAKHRAQHGQHGSQALVPLYFISKSKYRSRFFTLPFAYSRFTNHRSYYFLGPVVMIKSGPSSSSLRLLGWLFHRYRKQNKSGHRLAFLYSFAKEKDRSYSRQSLSLLGSILYKYERSQDLAKHKILLGLISFRTRAIEKVNKNETI